MTEQTQASADKKRIEPHEASRILLYTVIANLVVQFALGLVFLAFSAGLSPAGRTLWSLCGSLLIQIAYLFVYFRFVKHKNLSTQYHFRNRISPLSVLICMLAALCLLAALLLPTTWFDNLLQLTGYTPDPLVLDPSNLAVCIVAIVLVAPVIEELIFRGVLLSGFRQGGALKGILLAATAFMLSHFNPSQTFFQFFIGILCGLVVLFTGSLWAGIVTHMTSNLAALIIGLTSLDGLRLSLVQYLVAHPAVAVAVTAGALCVFGGLLTALLYALKRIGAKRNETQPEPLPVTPEKTRYGRVCYFSAVGIAVFMWLFNFIGTILL